MPSCDPKVLGNEVRRGLDAHNVLSLFGRTAAETFDEAPPSRKDVFLVRRLNIKNSYYYLVVMRDLGATPILALVDGQTFRYGGAHLLPRSVAGGIPTRQALENSLKSRARIDLGRNHVLPSAGVRVERTLVWKMCQESRTPFYPFYRAKAAGLRFYIGLDGAMYADLHDKTTLG
jgi:hypothetical protein